MIKFCFQIYIQNKIYNNINNALLCERLKSQNRVGTELEAD